MSWNVTKRSLRTSLNDACVQNSSVEFASKGHQVRAHLTLVLHLLSRYFQSQHFLHMVFKQPIFKVQIWWSVSMSR